MSGPLEPLWRLLREQPDPRHPDLGWRRELGDGYALVAAWLRVSRGTAGAWPCGIAGASGCERRVVEHGHDDLVAVCGDEPPRCDRVRVERSQVALRKLDLRALGELLVTTSGLPAASASLDGDAVVIGPVALGRARVSIAVTLDTSLLGLLGLAQDLRDRHGADRVLLLAPLEATLPAAEARALERVPADALPMGLALVPHGGELVGDLARWLVAHRSAFAGFDPLPVVRRHYDVVVDPAASRCAFGDTWVDFKRLQTPFRLLVGLAKRPGQLVTRDALFDDVWPGGDPNENETWEGNLRSHKRTLAGTLTKAGLPADELVETVDGDRYNGGYCLAASADRVLLVERTSRVRRAALGVGVLLCRARSVSIFLPPPSERVSR